MSASSILDFRVLVVPGLHGSGPEHWQSRWQRLYPYFERVEQAQWDVPDLAAWSEQLDRDLRRSSEPTLIAAHSFGCLATVHRLGIDTGQVAGALLVAPADPGKFAVGRTLRLARLRIPAIVVGSADDPWMALDAAADWSARWNAEFLLAGALGHINADSGLGDWAEGLRLLQRLAAAVPSKPYRNLSCRCAQVPNC